MNILFVAPLPPPITGNTLAIKIVHDELAKSHHVETVNLNKTSLQSGVNSVGRIIQIMGLLKNVFLKNSKADLIYFSISESFAGNLKDLLIYMLCFKKLDKVIVHMLGGAGMKTILEKNNLQSKINGYFFRKIKGIIVEGQAQKNTFLPFIPSEKIFKVPNFAEDFLFVSEEQIKDKFEELNPLRILYLSNLLYGKGYDELADAFIGLAPELQDKLELVYVGGFENDKSKKAFFEKIKDCKNISYLGNFISGEEKKKLYLKSHVFCLPTYYPYEGQPITILEAYATGCFVLTSLHSGIPEVFTDQVNGYAVEKKSVSALESAIKKIVECQHELLPIAINNRNLAFEKYRTSRYTENIKNIIEHQQN